jgi:hypothetical protein
MLPRLPAAAGVTPAGRLDAAPAVADPRQQDFQRAMSALVGKTMTATVLARLQDGGALVQVAGNAVRMALPSSLAAGAEVPLTLLSTNPRPTFQLGNTTQLIAGYAPSANSFATPAANTSASAAALSASLASAANAGSAAPQRSQGATLLAQAPLTPAADLPALAPDTQAPTLSPAARSIASALAGTWSAPGVPATILGKLPLVAAGAPDPERLQQGLKEALGKSGLFYESHVAEWAEGKRPLLDLMREPQNQRAQAQQQQAAGPQTSESLARAAFASPDLSAAQMINQQLHAHEQQRLQWLGQAWPGQPMQWDVQREEQRGNKKQPGDGAEAEQVWRSGVRFRLPLLGKVSAAVTLVGDQVHIQVQTGSGDSADTLRAWAGQLQQAMAAAGSPLASLTIAQESGGDDDGSVPPVAEGGNGL